MPISSAYAQAAGGAPAGFDLISLMPLVLIFVVFYFLLIRPQQKKMKAHRELIASVKRGDKVLTSGGIIGTVVKVEEGEDVLLVEIAKDVRVRVARGTISELLNKPQVSRTTAQAAADGSTEGAKTGLMSQLFGKK
jgi:preprotein translocase subunit YajC